METDVACGMDFCVKREVGIFRFLGESGFVDVVGDCFCSRRVNSVNRIVCSRFWLTEAQDVCNWEEEGSVGGV